MASILKYFKLAKPADDHFPDPEGILSSKLPSSANSEVRSVIDIHHFPICHCFVPRRLIWLLSAIITIDRAEKFAKLSSTKLVSLPNFNPSKLSSFTVFKLMLWFKYMEYVNFANNNGMTKTFYAFYAFWRLLEAKCTYWQLVTVKII